MQEFHNMFSLSSFSLVKSPNACVFPPSCDVSAFKMGSNKTLTKLDWSITLKSLSVFLYLYSVVGDRMFGIFPLIFPARDRLPPNTNNSDSNAVSEQDM